MTVSRIFEKGAHFKQSPQHSCSTFKSTAPQWRLWVPFVKCATGTISVTSSPAMNKCFIRSAMFSTPLSFELWHAAVIILLDVSVDVTTAPNRKILFWHCSYYQMIIHRSSLPSNVWTSYCNNRAVALYLHTHSLRSIPVHLRPSAPVRRCARDSL